MDQAKIRGTGSVAPLVERLLGEHEVLSSTSRTTKLKKKF
jgi:hypothetical protein